MSRGAVARAGVTAGLLAGFGLGGCADDREAGPDRDADVAGAAAATRRCGWPIDPAELALPRSEVRGVLSGASRNPSTGCTRQKGSGGPEAVYLLRLAERRLVELEVASALDTVIAVRRACDDPLTELACNDDDGVAGSLPAPAPPAVPGRPVDAGVDAPAAPGFQPSGSGRDARLRTTLEAGDYYVLIDEAEAHGVGGPFVLRVGSGPPPAQSSCASAQPIEDGTVLVREELALSTELAPDCTGAPPRPGLYYRVRVPSGQRLTVRVLPTGGDPLWTPVLQLHSGCTGGICLATDHPGRNGRREVQYVNHGPTEESVVLSVAANGTVAGATFNLEAIVAEPVQNTSCATARPLSDGLLLPAQELPDGPSGGGPQCTPADRRSLYYSATLLERQTLEVAVQPRNPVGRNPLTVTVWEFGCGDPNCRGGRGQKVGYINPGPGPRTVVLAVTSEASEMILFDLSVSMPLPAAGIRVNAGPGLQTSEPGAQARFEVALASPPAAAVVIPIASSDPAEGIPSPAQLRFEPTGWQTPQTVTVTGVNDDRPDGTRRYQVRLGPASSDDPRYAGREGTPVELINRDDEPGFTIEARRPLRTFESGARASFQVALVRAPAAPVLLPLASSDPGEGQVSPAELVFQPSDWDQPRTVTVAGVDDAEVDGPAAYRVLTGPASSADPMYAGLDPEDVEARNLDNDHVRVAAQVVSGDLDCPSDLFAFQGQPAVRRMAVDEAGVLYLVLSCKLPTLPLVSSDAGVVTPATGSVFVAVSEDGGRSWRPPIDTGLLGNGARIVAAGAGRVVVAASGASGLVVGHSEDFAATWAAARSFSPMDSQWHLGAAGSRVVLTGSLDYDVALWVSDDAGRTFDRVRGLRFFPFDLGVDADGGAIWAAGYPMLDGLVLTASRDRGLTFERVLDLGDEPFESMVVGQRYVYASTSELPRLLVLARDGSTRTWVDGLLATVMNPRLLVGDQQENVTVVEGGFERTHILRLAAGGTSFPAPRLLDATEWPPDGVALSSNAVAISLYRAGRVLVTVEAWP